MSENEGESIHGLSAASGWGGRFCGTSVDFHALRRSTERACWSFAPSSWWSRRNTPVLGVLIGQCVTGSCRRGVRFLVGCQWSPWAPPARMEPTRVPRAPGPRLIFLVATLALTFAATGLLCGAIMSDHWEEVGWDKEALTHANITLTWYLDGQIAMLEQTSGHRNHHSGRRPIFLVPMYGGIWIMCVSLTEEEIRLLGQVGFPQERCINYLAPDEAHEEVRAAWQNRMQNLSISCSLVCLIILGTAVLIGFFGLCRHQISAVLVTGVMYLLAVNVSYLGIIVTATFALFTLTIIHFKRAQDRGARILDGPEDGVIGGPVPRSVLKARRFSSSWSMDFAWGGVTLCALASVAWILLSKIMRFSPIAAMIA